MHLLPRGIVFFIFLICTIPPVSADLISPEAQAARDRLRANPRTYDRVDDFCSGKKPGANCIISGTTFSGGGEGVCLNDISSEDSSIIDLSCVRNSEMTIDRKLPEGGFVNDPGLCRMAADRGDRQRWNCTPTVPTPSDRFCIGKSLGSICTVELTYQGKSEQHSGVCREETETENFYFQGHRTATRQVIRCEPPITTSHTFTAVKWHQKLLP